MGGQGYYYGVPYEDDIDRALQSLRKREFEAGRYNPVVPFLEFDASSTPSPGKNHASIQEALDESEADGTRSILDIERIASKPSFGAAVLLPGRKRKELYGTEKPTRLMVTKNLDFFEEIDRGQAVYFILFEDERPSEIFFAGVSCD
jgi:hypothetical protein